MQLTIISFVRVSILSLVLLFTIQCGSFQNTSYYSDGIYSDQDVVVVKKKKTAPNTYSAYFDEQANRYQWQQSDESVVMTNSDSLNQGNIQNYQTNANWGGGPKNTQIIVQTNPWDFGFNPYAGFWNYNDFYHPYWGQWNSPFNRGYFWNRFAYGNFYRSFYSPFTPFYLNGYYYGNPFFNGFNYGYGYGYNNYFNNRFNDRIRSDNQRANRVRSSSYRGKAGTPRTRETLAGTQRSSVNPRQNETAVEGRTASREDKALIVPDLVHQGRRQQAQRTIDRRAVRNQEQQDRSTIERMIRDLQSQGYNVDVLTREEQNRNTGNSYNSSTGSGNGRSNLSRNNSSNSSTKNTANARRSSNNSFNSRSNSNPPSFSRSSSRSSSPPPRASSTSRRSSSSGNSSSGSGRRQ